MLITVKQIVSIRLEYIWESEISVNPAMRTTVEACLACFNGGGVYYGLAVRWIRPYYGCGKRFQEENQ